MEIVHLLVCTDVQRADNDFLPRHALQHTLVRQKLLFFVGIVIIFQIQKFAPEQSDTAGIVEQHCTDIVHTADVGIDVDFGAVPGNVFLAFQFQQQTLFLLVCLLLFQQPPASFLVRFHENLTGKAVYDRLCAVLYLFQKIAAHTDDCRNVHVPSQNRCVRVGRTVCRHKCQHLVLIQRNGFAGGEVVRTNDVLFAGIFLHSNASRQIGNDAVGNVPHVSRTSLHIGIVHGGEHLGEVVRRNGNRILSIDFLGINDVLNALVVVVIFQHHHVDLKDLSIGFTHFFQCLFIDRL